MRNLLLLLACLFTTSLLAQNKRIDSLKGEIEKHPSYDSVRFQLLSSTAFALMSARELNEAKVYNDQSMEVAQRLNMPWMIATAIRIEGIIEFNKRNYNNALKLAFKAEKILLADIEKTGRAMSKLKLLAIYIDIKLAYITMENYPEAISYSHKVIDMGMQQKNYKTIIPVMVELGLIYKRTDNLPDAEIAYQHALDVLQLWEKQDSRNVDYYNKARIYGNLAEIYGLRRDYDKSISYFLKAEPLLETEISSSILLDARVKWAIYQNAAFNYKELGKWERAFACLEKGEQFVVKLGSAMNRISELSKWSIYAEAPDSVINKSITNLPQKFEQAISAFEQMRKDTGMQGISFDAQLQLLSTLSNIYEKAQKFDQSLSVYKEYVILKDSMTNMEKQKEFIRKDVQFAFSKREDSIKLQQQLTQLQLTKQSLLARQNEQALQLSNQEKEVQRLTYLTERAALEKNRAELEKMNAETEKEVVYQNGLVKQNKLQSQVKDKQIQAQDAQIQYNRNRMIALIAGVVLLAIIAGIVFYSQRKTARLNKMISKQNDVLEHQKTELSVQGEKLTIMMKELNHRVKNNLQVVSSLLNLQSYRLHDTEAIAAITESKQRVQAMSLLHQRLYKTDDVTRINMKDYIKELSSFLASSYGYNQEKLDLFLHVDEEWLDIDKAMPVGLIVNELVTNAFKYAYEGVNKPLLQIDLKNTGTSLSLSVKDNGKGIPEAKWNNDDYTSSFGRQLVKALCSQLNATEKLIVNNGSNFMYQIPKAA